MGIIGIIGILIFFWYMTQFGKPLPFKPLWMSDRESPGHLIMWAILIGSIIILTR